MGATVSRAESPPTGLQVPASVYGSAAAAAVNAKEAVQYLNLPTPVRYEELTREAYMSLKPETFEGLRFDFSKPLNQNFALTHQIHMGNIEIPTNNPKQALKMSMGTYEFGATVASTSGNIINGRIGGDGRLSGMLKYDFAESLSARLTLQLAQEKGMSQAMMDWLAKGSDWTGQIRVGSHQFYGLNYFQSVTPTLSLGGELFWWRSQMKAGYGLAARHATDTSISTLQVASTGLVAATYVHKISDKAQFATELTWHMNSREATACVGYDYILRQCRIRGRVDSDGKIAAYLEERVNMGVNFVLSAEVDHHRKDYKFGFGMTVGE